MSQKTAIAWMSAHTAATPTNAIPQRDGFLRQAPEAGGKGTKTSNRRLKAWGRRRIRSSKRTRKISVMKAARAGSSCLSTKKRTAQVKPVAKSAA